MMKRVVMIMRMVTDVDDHYNGYDDYEDNCAEDKIIMVILLKFK